MSCARWSSRRSALRLPAAEARCGSSSGPPIVAHQLGLGGQLLVLLQPAPADRLAQVVGYLLVDGTITCRVDSLGEHVRAHARDSSTRAHVYDCQVTQGDQLGQPDAPP